VIKTILILIALLLFTNLNANLSIQSEANNIFIDSNELNKKFDYLTKKYGSWLLVEIVKIIIEHSCTMDIYEDLNNDKIQELVCVYPPGNSTLAFGNIFQIIPDKRTLKLIHKGGLGYSNNKYSNGWKVYSSDSRYDKSDGKSVTVTEDYYFHNQMYYNKYWTLNENDSYNDGNYEISKKKFIKREYDPTGNLIFEEEILKTVKEYK